MSEAQRRIGILTSGGDAPGLNAVIRGIVRRGDQLGHEFVGIRYGWAGVLDRKTVPLDVDTIRESVRKTGRCVVVYEAPKTCGYGAERSAIVAEKCIEYLEGPVVRVAGFDTPFPYTLEHTYLPDAKRVSAADAASVKAPITAGSRAATALRKKSSVSSAPNPANGRPDRIVMGWMKLS